MTPDLTKQELTKTAEIVLSRRYYLKDESGEPVESWETLCKRVSSAVAEVDKDSDQHEALRESFFRMMYHLDFLPNSPFLMNAGTDLDRKSVV